MRRGLSPRGSGPATRRWSAGRGGEGQHEVVGELEQVGAAFDWVGEVRGKRSLAVQGAENVAADRPGGVAVPGVADRESEGVGDLRGSAVDQCRVHRDRERFLGDPPFAQRFDVLRAGGAPGSHGPRGEQRPCSLLVPGVAAQFGEHRVQRGVEVVPGQQPPDQQGERPGRSLSGGVAVGERRGPVRPGEDGGVGGDVVGEQAEGGAAHHPAAAFGAVAGGRSPLLAAADGVLQRLQAGAAGARWWYSQLRAASHPGCSPVGAETNWVWYQRR